MTKEEMISLMKKLAAEQGEAPTLVKFLEAGKLMTRAFRKQFGMYNDVLKTGRIEAPGSRASGAYEDPV